MHSTLGVMLSKLMLRFKDMQIKVKEVRDVARRTADKQKR